MQKDNTSFSESREDVTLSHGVSSIELTNARPEDKYDPLEHRIVAHPSSTLGSFFNLLKSSLGSGLLAMPAAFKHSGLIPGCIGTAIVAIIATHCVQILVSTSRETCKQLRIPSLNYTDTCEKVFKNGPGSLRKYSQIMRYFADYAMAGVCLGGTSVYVVFIASSLKDIFDHFVTENVYSVEAYCGFLLVPLILITQFHHLKFLVPFSILANACLLVTFFITCFYTFQDIPKIESTMWSSRVTQWPLFVSIAIFAMEGINIVMPIENEMAEPGKFLGCPGVLNSTMALVALLYGFLGVFGYLKYGCNAKGSITLNLPKDETLSMIAKALVAVAVFCTYCLQMYAPVDIIWLRIKYIFKENYYVIGQIAVRTISVSLTVLLAVAVPDLENLMNLAGAIFFSTLGLLIPIIIETVHKWERGLGKYFYIAWKNMIILIFYVIVLISGCYSAVSKIMTR